MSRIYFHDLPVYRLSDESYRTWKDAYVSQMMNEALRDVSLSEKEIKNMRNQREGYHYDRYGAWRFNEIVGYVRLYFFGSQLRGEYYLNNKSRQMLSREKLFHYKTHKLAPEVEIPETATNSEILKLILKYVDNCRKEQLRRYFDDFWLQSIGPFVDWNALRRAWRRNYRVVRAAEEKSTGSGGLGAGRDGAHHATHEQA